LFKKRAGFFSKGRYQRNAKIGWDHLKIFSRTTKPEELIFTGKLFDIM
jgi:hypothetical protein